MKRACSVHVEVSLGCWSAPGRSLVSTPVLEARPGCTPGGGGGVSPMASLVSPTLLGYVPETAKGVTIISSTAQFELVQA